MGKLGNLDWLLKYEGLEKEDSVFVLEDFLKNESKHKKSLVENNYSFITLYYLSLINI